MSADDDGLYMIGGGGAPYVPAGLNVLRAAAEGARHGEHAEAELRFADEEPIRLLLKGISEAAGMLAALTGEERDGLPDAALLGIARLRGAIAEFTGEEPPQKLPEGEPLRYGLVIELPAPRTSPPMPIVFAEVLLHEIDPAGAERPLPGVTGLTLRLSPGECMTADVESLVGEDGEPLAAGAEPAERDGEFATAVFRYVVAAARVTDVWARRPRRPLDGVRET